ncbi:Cytochrome b5 isoform A [Hibiscus syriacus]|uniref:Cytochrome b5 isoform A n=1 Tax=Hibiscus syriacus TaxID=106335 RepID=A0A6A2XD74_HIBSY|nr:cytochrome b5-like [Hibiscus syriacus]KAE8673252.1 Cytochrome b5 isoform A [Hibiscus syriacus]
MQEASQHNTKDDCWVVIDCKVYDVTSYLDEHPGGDDVVLVATGKDATADFEDAGHSESAKELMQSFCIGELDTSSSPIIPELKISSKKETTEYSQKLMDLTKQYWTIPVTIVGISMVVGFLYMYKK